MVRHILKRFRKDEKGAILVEFGLVLPIMLLFFGMIVEGTRMLAGYQAAVAGVRDAGRYLARVAPRDICATGGSVAGYAATLKAIVENDINGNPLLPALVTVNSVTPTHVCVTGTYRGGTVPVATVTANMTIDFPLASIMTMFGQSMPNVTTTFADSSRIFGT